MSRLPEVREAGDSAVLLQFEAVIDPAVNERVIAIADAIRARGLPGIRDVVPAFRSVAVHFDPIALELEAVVDVVTSAAANTAATLPRSADVELPVTYGGEAGPDLNDVASFAGLSPRQVIERHAAGEYRVYMLGFLPGFPYMAAVPPEIAMPRRATPRLRVARGSVGIAGRQTGIYPMDSPGGWQIVGRTGQTLFDPSRSPTTLLSPGDRVSFIPESTVGAGARASRVERAPAPTQRAARRVTVLRPGLFTTIQDRGRWGTQSQGVPVGGAMDSVSHRVANALVGNDPAAATLEATLVGPELRVEQDTTVGIAGANLSATLDRAAVPANAAVRCAAGSVIRFGERARGTRAYIAFDGGIDTPLVLGSRSTHTRSRLGGMDGRPLAAGDEVPLGSARDARGRAGTLDLAVAGGARVRVRPGPQADAFPAESLDRLQRTRFTVSPQSDRMGFRLEGGRLARVDAGDMISDATFPGGIQIPPSGEPIVLMADRQTTGGYPQVATIITADLPRVAQLGPGDWIEFEVCSRAEAIRALVAQEGSIGALG